jgi:hypothetical protein
VTTLTKPAKLPAACLTLLKRLSTPGAHVRARRFFPFEWGSYEVAWKDTKEHRDELDRTQEDHVAKLAACKAIVLLTERKDATSGEETRVWGLTPFGWELLARKGVLSGSEAIPELFNTDDYDIRVLNQYLTGMDAK